MGKNVILSHILHERNQKEHIDTLCSFYQVDDYVYYR